MPGVMTTLFVPKLDVHMFLFSAAYLLVLRSASGGLVVCRWSAPISAGQLPPLAPLLFRACAVERWGGWFLFGLFAGILIWEEVWDLPDTAYLSSWLLLIITGGAVVCSAFFERRLWCRWAATQVGGTWCTGPVLASKLACDVMNWGGNSAQKHRELRVC